MPGCVITNPVLLSNCITSTGGVYTVYVAGHVKNTVFGKSTGNLINGYDSTALGGTLAFKEIQQDIEIANATDPSTGTRSSGTVSYAPGITLTIVYGKDPAANDLIRTTLIELSKGNLIVIVKENSGIHRMYGKENGLRMVTTAGGTGTSFDDLNGIVMTLAGKETEPASIIDLTTTPQAPMVAFGL